MHGFASLGELAFAELPLGAQEATASPFKLLLRDPSAAREFLVELYPFQFGAGTAAFLPSSVADLGLWLAADLSERTLNGSTISQWNDFSGNGNHASQGTAANQPLLTRADNLQNLVLQSEDFSTTWIKTEVSVSANADNDPNGGTTADTVIPSTNSSSHTVKQDVPVLPSKPYTFSSYAKASGYNFVILIVWDGTSNIAWAGFDLSTGTIASTTAGTAAIEDVGGGIYRCSVFATTGASASTTTNTAYISSSNSISAFVGDGTSGVSLWGAQVNGGALLDYVLTGTVPAHPGIGGHAVLHFDGDNDLLSVAADATIDNIFDGGGYGATVFSVDQIKSPSDWERIFEKGSVGVYVSGNSGGAGRLTFWQQFSGDDATWVTTTPDQWPILAGRSHLLEIQYDNGDLANDPTIWIDGQTVAFSQSTTPTGTRSDDSGNALNLGNDGTNARELEGSIAEVALYSSVPSAIEQRKIRDYLMTKYGIARFTPGEIADLGVWLAGDLSPRTMNGSDVSQWDDLSGNGNHATQVTGSAQPSLGAVAGLPALVFDGVSEYMTVASDASFENPRELTVFLVQHSDTPGTWGHVLNQDGGSPNEGWRVQAFSTTNDEVYPAIRTSAGSQELQRVTSVFYSAPTIYDMRLDNGSFKSHRIRSGVTVNEATDSYDEGTDGFRANKPLQIAAPNPPGAGAYGALTIAEILIYARALTDTEIVSVQNYLKSKYAISPT